jgi:hypothetical protein
MVANCVGRVAHVNVAGRDVLIGRSEKSGPGLGRRHCHSPHQLLRCLTHNHRASNSRHLLAFMRYCDACDLFIEALELALTANLAVISVILQLNLGSMRRARYG